MTEQTSETTEVEQEPTLAERATLLAEQAEQDADDAILAADAADAMQATASRHAAQAAHAATSRQWPEAGDEASAAAAAAERVRRYAAAAANSHDRAAARSGEVFLLGGNAVDAGAQSPLPPADVVELDALYQRATAAVATAADARYRASAARYAAEDEAKQAGDGVDWLRYHMDGHCQGWKERTGA
jgi:hypothetical protein